MLIKNKIINHIEKLFLLSPLLVILIMMFNFSDTKFILSRLIPIVSIYCLLKYREAIRANWNSVLRSFFISGLLIIVIFSGYHFFRGDEFSLPRTLIVSLVYLLFVPWNKISSQWVYYIAALASVICGLNALYEHFVMNIARVGIATNPIPYALYASFLLLCCVYLLLNQSDKILKAIAAMGGLLSLTAIIMTDVRGVILFLPVVILYLMIATVKPTVKHYIVLCCSICTISVLFYAIFDQEIDARIEQTRYEFSMIEKGKHHTSIGVRLDLWKHGLDVIAHDPIFGLGDDALEKSIASINNRGAAVQPHLHNQYLDSLARYGVVGTLVMLLCCFALIVNFTRSGVKYIGNPLVNSMLIMLMLAGLTDVPLHHTHLIYLLTILCGLLILFSEMGKDKNRHLFK